MAREVRHDLVSSLLMSAQGEDGRDVFLPEHSLQEHVSERALGANRGAIEAG